MSVPRSAPLLAAILAAGCASQWYPGAENLEIVRTEVVVQTVPTGAAVSFNGVDQARSPVRIPVEYDHTARVYERQTNAGQSIRDGMSPVVEVLTFPIWAIPSLFHHKEQRLVHIYGNNRHVVSAHLSGYEDARTEIELQGEKEFRVEVPLVKVK